MLNDKEIINVRNRDNGSVGYTIPDLGNLHRNFQAGEVKKVTMEELRKLSYIPGGEVLLRDYLVIENNPEAIAELLGEVEIEYSYTEEDVKKLLSDSFLCRRLLRHSLRFYLEFLDLLRLSYRFYLIL